MAARPRKQFNEFRDLLLCDPNVLDLSPADLLEELHSLLGPLWAMTEGSDEEWQVEALAVLLQPDGSMRASTAGRLYPWVCGAGGWACWNVGGNWPLGTASLFGQPLGPAHRVPYAESTRSLAVGELLLGFTDGVLEAGGSHGQQFHVAGLGQFFAGIGATLGPAALLSALFAAVQAHEGTAWPSDDVTAFCYQRP